MKRLLERLALRWPLRVTIYWMGDDYQRYQAKLEGAAPQIVHEVEHFKRELYCKQKWAEPETTWDDVWDLWHEHVGEEVNAIIDGEG